MARRGEPAGFRAISAISHKKRPVASLAVRVVRPVRLCRRCRMMPSLTGDFRAPYGSATAGWWLVRENPRDGSLAWDPSSPGNFASNSASEIPNAPAVALFGAPSAIIARTKRRSASPNFEAPHFSAASASLRASTRGVIAFGFRPEPGLAPPRPIPLDFVIFKPKMMQREIVSPLVWGSRARVRGGHENFMRGTRASARTRSLAFLVKMNSNVICRVSRRPAYQHLRPAAFEGCRARPRIAKNSARWAFSPLIVRMVPSLSLREVQ